ncbi:mucin-5AC-like isoform X4 [Pomacea canaliculata]|uniref:mucin-5AC-like isoform X4 n=1 Tax=Pomacea canaliculata TaxID=400727 RepID=UPI000D73672E|nr:mucin-5AC-like isoform X4 [Pomacea canaliculata]
MAFTMVILVAIMIFISQGGTVAGATTRTSGSVPTTTTARATAPTSATATLRTSGPTEASTTITSGPTAATATTRTSGAIPTSTSASATGPTGAATTARTSAQTAATSTASTSGPTIAGTTPLTSGSVPTTTTTRATVPTSAAPTAFTSGPTATATTTRTSAPTTINIAASQTAQTAATSTASIVTSGPIIAGTTPVTSGSVPTTTATRATVPISSAPTANTSGQTATATTTRTSGPMPTATTASPSDTTPTSTTVTSVCSVDAPTLNVVPWQVGYLTSPNYPFNYYNNADCRWLILASGGYVVRLTVLNFNLETCCDYLELYDGAQQSSSSHIIRTSSISSQSVFYSSGQYMYIRFYTDYSVTYSGFRLTYEAINQQSVPTSVPTSGSTTTSTTGPPLAPTATNIAASQTVQTTATSTASTSGPTTAATTPVTSGSIPTTTTTRATVPTSAAPTANTSGQTATATTTRTSGAIPTSTSASATGPTGAATTARTSGPVPATTAASPPGSIASATTARTSAPIAVNITASPAAQTATTSTASTSGPTIAATTPVTSGSTPTTTTTRITVPTSPAPTANTSGQTATATTTRTSGAIPTTTTASPTVPTSATTTASTSVPFSSFTTTRTSDTTPTSTTAVTSVCSIDAPTLNVVPGQVGYLTSPNYPSPYYNNADCRWLIFASGYVVRLTVLNFNLETGWDFLELYDGAQQSSSPLIIRTSYPPSQSVLYSSGQYMYIRFYSDYSITYSGFRLTYEAINQQSVPTSLPTSGPPLVWTSSGTTLSAVPGQVGYLTSPYYPSVYSGYFHCSWVINSASGYAIKATLWNATNSDFNFYIVIYDGPSDSSRLVAWVSSTTSQAVYYSSGQSMYITFLSYGFSQNSFFNLTYEAVNQSSSPWSVCSSNGTTLTAVPGQVRNLTSLYFPSVYYGFIYCSWTIISTNCSVVKATLLNVTNPDIDLYIAIYDGMSASSPSLAGISNMSSQNVYYSSGQSMYIWVATYGLGPNSFLSLTYEAVDQRSVPTSDTTTTSTTAAPSVCSVYAPTLNVVPGQVGYLTSPNYPYPYNKSDSTSYTTSIIGPLHVYMFMCLYLFTPMMTSSTTDHIWTTGSLKHNGSGRSKNLF